MFQSQPLVGTTQQIKKQYIPELNSDYPIATQVHDNETNEIISASYSEISLGTTYRVRYISGHVTGFPKPHSGYFKVSRDFIDTKWTSYVDWNLDQETKTHGEIKDNFTSWVVTKSYFDLGHMYPDVKIGQITWKPAPPEELDRDDRDDNGLSDTSPAYYILSIEIGNEVTEYEPSKSLQVSITIPDDIWGIQANLSSRFTGKMRNNSQLVTLNGDKQIVIGNTITLRRDEGVTDEIASINLLGEKWTPQLEFIDQSYEGWVHHDSPPSNPTPPNKNIQADFSDSYLEITKNNYQQVDITRAVKAIHQIEGESEIDEPLVEESEGVVNVAASEPSNTIRLPSQDLDLGDVPGLILVNSEGITEVFTPPAAGNLISTDEDGNWIEYSQDTLVQNINNLLQITFADPHPQQRTVYSSGYIDNLPLGLTKAQIQVLLTEEVPRLYRNYVDIYGVEAPQVHTNYLRVGGQADSESALLVINSDLESPKGFLPPRLTTNERNRIYSPTEGLTIYNEQSQQFEFYDGLYWLPIGANIEFTLNTTIIDSSITLEKYGYFLVDTSNGVIDLTLPNINIQEGKAVDFIDLKGSILSTGATGFGLNKLNIHPNEGQTIQGQDDFLQLDKDNEVLGLIYTQGDWRIYRRAHTGSAGGDGSGGGLEFLPLNNNMVLIAGQYYFNDIDRDISVFMPEDPVLGDHLHIRNNSEFSISVSAGFNSHIMIMPNRTYEFVYLQDRWSCTLLGVDIDYIWTIDHIEPPVIESYTYGTLSGIGQGDLVEIEVNNEVVGSTSIDPNDGSWEFTDVVLTTGTNTIIATGVKNDLREASEEFILEKPSPPVITEVTDESIQGTGTFGYVVAFSINDTELTSMASTDLLGNWFLAKDLEVGINRIKVRQLNETVKSDYSDITEYTVIPIPNEPTILSVTNTSITLTADIEISVVVYKNSSELDPVENDTVEEITIDHGGLIEGENTFTARAFNSEWEGSPETPEFTVTKPITPSIDSHSILSNTEAELSGTGESGVTLKLYLANSEVAETTIDENGNWSISPTLINPGANVFTSKSFISNIHSDTSNEKEIFLLRTPTINGLTSQVDLTNDTQYFVTGTGDSDKSIKLFLNGNEMPETGQADSSGDWSITVNLSPGPTEIKAKSYNNNTESNFSNAINKTVPSAPVIDSYTPPNLTGTAMSSSHQLLLYRLNTQTDTLEDVSNNWSIDISGSIDSSNNNYRAISNNSLHSKLSNQFSVTQVTELIEITTEYNDTLGFDETIFKVINTTGKSGDFNLSVTVLNDDNNPSLFFGNNEVVPPGSLAAHRSATLNRWWETIEANTDITNTLKLEAGFESEDGSLAFTEEREFTYVRPNVTPPEFVELSNTGPGGFATSELKVINRHGARALIQVNHENTLISSFELDADGEEIIDFTSSEYMGMTIDVTATATVTTEEDGVFLAIAQSVDHTFTSSETSINYEVQSNDLNMIQKRTDPSTGIERIKIVNILNLNLENIYHTDPPGATADNYHITYLYSNYHIFYVGKRVWLNSNYNWVTKDNDDVIQRTPGTGPFDSNLPTLSITAANALRNEIKEQTMITLQYSKYSYYLESIGGDDDLTSDVPYLPSGTEITVTLNLNEDVTYSETKTFIINSIDIDPALQAVQKGVARVTVTNPNEVAVYIATYEYYAGIDYSLGSNTYLIGREYLEAGDSVRWDSSNDIQVGRSYFSYTYIGSRLQPIVVKRSNTMRIEREESEGFGGGNLTDMLMGFN